MEILTGESLSSLFDTPIEFVHVNGYFSGNARQGVNRVKRKQCTTQLPSSTGER